MPLSYYGDLQQEILKDLGYKFLHPFKPEPHHYGR